jgi:hypothetical protein
MSKEDGGPAFPRMGVEGMTLRDWFAGQALVGLIVEGRYKRAGASPTTSDAYILADCMLDRRASQDGDR